MRIAVLQSVAGARDVENNLGVLERAAAQSHRHGADVLVTPELFATGYEPAAVAHLDGATIRSRVAELAASNDVAIVSSTVEHDGPHRFITATLVGRDGATLTHYRKTHLFGLETEHFTPGDALPEVVACGDLSVALGICFDVEFGEFVRDAADRGAQALLVPTAVPTSPGYDAAAVPRMIVPTRAMESTVAIAYANHAGPGFVSGSRIVEPTGRVAVAANRTRHLIHADITPTAVAAARNALPYLRVRRRDLY